MSPASLTTAGVIFITVPTIAFGGASLLGLIGRRIPGYLDNPVRRGLWRAGHAHAGVLVMLALVALLYVDQSDLSGGLRTLVRVLFAAAPILMPLGFFLSVLRPGDTRPGRLIWLTAAGGLCLSAGAVILGAGLL
ncbi:hypothetical protein Sme01_71990 [Sphaerisporangium melleum]|uniref:DUF8059 domain-containing protein n=1 Tax=Sphaerisporangium melleum TaxID=321316 RepID=A0A917VV97_9ACTN|nr:hypothetical protein [Sphaerisporangium melleum]GGL17471.1 hypothetical protein GCM10007964_69410 [Sphaerisporangium melleum]GII74723.1 hypothetical protein Sme01_71990 [Sphaerisporangium melleum]